ncbi:MULTISPECIES: DUF3742 family protein [Pseudomonas]|uniref:DUF3742 family protein n=1 Tax=Pseudomonas TaxID=286 RepID=UPI0006D8B131|nr:DUF3742 family protein [Pseudomonas sp. ICMP22404]
MRRQEQATRAERLGEYAGRCWRSYLRVLDRLSGGLQRLGIPNSLSRIIALGLQVSVLFVLLFVAFWGAIIVAFIFVVSRSIGRSGQQREDWAIGEQYDERDDPSYDPINYSRTSDPRFDDE